METQTVPDMWRAGLSFGPGVLVLAMPQLARFSLSSVPALYDNCTEKLLSKITE